MVNRHRGEIEAILGGERRRLCLTLGALAELEHAFGAEDMLALAQRFEAGRLSARDAIRIIAAGLRGAGGDAGEAEVARMQAEGGAAGYVDIVVRLLGATFGAPGGPGGAGAIDPALRSNQSCPAHGHSPSQTGPSTPDQHPRDGIPAFPDGNGPAPLGAPGESRAPGK